MPLLRFHTAGVRVDLDCPDSATAALVAAVGSSMTTDSATAPDVSVSCPASPDQGLEQTAALALSLVDRAALAHSRCLTVHAAALSGPRGCVVVPAASGSGKTTLAGAAMQSGLTLLSDEAACFTEPVGRLVPHPRPLGLSLASRRLLGLDSPDDEDIEQATAPGLLGETAPQDYRGECVLVALPARREGAAAALEPVTPAEGLAALLGSCLNVPSQSDHGWQPAQAWRYLSTLAPAVRLARLTYDSPYAGARLLVEALGS